MLTSTLADLARQSLAALRTLIVFTVILGIGYPLTVWVAGRTMPDRADGQLLHHDGQVVGSALIGQHFTGAEWFHSRPSASDYDPLASGPSNMGPLSPDLRTAIAERRAAVAHTEGVPALDVPPDALTGSGSGVDPHISPEYAALQVTRVAVANGLTRPAVEELIAAHTQRRFAGILGEPVVNVVTLNLSLQRARR